MLSLSPLYYLIAIPILLTGLLIGEKKKNIPWIIATKPLLSGLFILLGITQCEGIAKSGFFMIAALCLCFIGDICLIFQSKKKIFMLGLAAFLTGHILYIIAFVLLAGVQLEGFLVLTPLIFAGRWIYKQLEPNLKEMKLPVIIYIVIITLMVTLSISLTFNKVLPMSLRILIPLGATLFYLSDLTVARHRFQKEEFLNRAIGLPLYYSAQFILAYSLIFFY